jgi:hypothetical protein
MFMATMLNLNCFNQGFKESANTNHEINERKQGGEIEEREQG